MAPLPSGIVTFVFTDIEGSTRLFRQLGSRYRPNLEAHRRLLREAFRRHGGVEVQTEGDGFFVAFQRPGSALRACLDGQLALLRFPWPEGAEVRVRMGVHTGEAEAVNGDYVALAVHQAARVAAAGHGGQVLISASTRHAAEDSLPDGAGLMALGAYLLKDFDEPQDLYQLTHRHLVAEFPALRVLPARGHNLPVSPTSFVGREREVAGVASLVESAPLVTLTGPGGVGKTRLALEVARHALPGFSDGVWWCELASLGDPASLPAALASVLGVREQPGRRLEEALADALRGRASLVVLDNCEHVIGACVALIATLLRAVTGLHVLATSREPIGVSGERIWAVAPLDLPDLGSPLEVLERQDAVRLFLDRAVAVRHDFALTDSSGRAVAQICRMLDGLPLALELAAARVSMLSPPQIVSKLDRRLPLLSSGARDAPSRQRALRATIEWSYSLLTEREQRFLRRLSVFSGGCTLEAAERVTGAELDDVQSLVDKSLLRMIDDRLSMLDTIREFAQEALESTGEAGDLLRRHAEHFGAAAPELGWRARGSDPSALAQIDAEYDNSCAAFDWALAHGAFEVCEQLVEGLWYPWVRRGLTTDGYRRALAALEHSPSPSATLMSLVGELARFTGDLDRAVQLKRTSLATYEAAGAATREIAASHTDLAEALIESGDFAGAEQHAERGLALRQRDGDSFGIAHARAALVMLELARGNDRRAAALADESIPTFRERQSWSDLAWECVRAATAYGRAGDIASARERLRDGFKYAGDIGEAAVTIAAIEQAAVLAALTSDDEPAVRLLGATRAARKSTGFVLRTDESVLTIVGARVATGRREVLLEEGARWDLDEATRQALDTMG